ncbi:methylated-DNA--[protein]-cysteine S-methyltransferase [Mesorhizobium sp.]|uniref:methylated-DNA--[protein]-cysteine S-methyltransferase n=1 Tax=Mesorhizobium sp. TaxID=1871066 RepID=UPI003BAB17EF
MERLDINAIETMNTATFPPRPTRRAGGSNEIAFAIGDGTLGMVLVARGAVGVCAIAIGEDEDELMLDLAGRFPAARHRRDEAGLRPVLASVIRFIANPGEELDLPLDVSRGTPFQRRVWDELRTIPTGATISYGALARRIGKPGSVRAVANACAANAIALGIPCHRVIHDDGTLSGYRWGVESKRALLESEIASRAIKA